MKSNRKHFNSLLLQNNFKWFCATLLILLSIACWLIIPFVNGDVTLPLIIGVLFVVLIVPFIPFLSSNFRKHRKRLLIERLNETVDSLNYSSRLLLKDEADLNVLEQLQVAKSATYIKENCAAIKLKSSINAILIFFFLNLFSVIIFSSFENKKQNIIKSTYTKQQLIIENELLVANDTLKLIKHNIAIKAPTYTQLKIKNQKSLNVVAPEGSNIVWTYHFNNQISKPPNFSWLNKNEPFSTKDDFSFSKALQPKSNLIYSVNLEDLIESSYLNKIAEIKLIKDEAPIIKVTKLKAYEEVDISNINSIDFQYQLSDDYGISKADVHLILSSGLGEGVSFREDYITLNGITNKASYQKNIDLAQYEPKPGDEFYIRIKATDNKPVNANTSYSSTFIIAVKDTTKTVATFEMALGMDVEPEYFRSQRQLIIDTENLLTQKIKLTTTAYKEESNNIGIEQKLLRLRYGKFLGEEFEGEIGVRKDKKEILTKKEVVDKEITHSHKEHLEHKHIEGEEHSHDYEHEKIAFAEEHKHGEDCEHNDSEDEEHQHLAKKYEDENDAHQHEGHDHHGHHHSTNNEDPEEEENLLAPFMHFHDSGEINTYFESEVKSKLKAALAEMWQSELQLRIGKPKASLPFQNKALKLIKEVQQASRVYVERVGMTMPEIPISKKRLTGDLDEVKDLTRNDSYKESKKFAALKDAIGKLNKINVEELSLPVNLKQINNLLQQLYLASDYDPIMFSKTINLVQQLAAGKNKIKNKYINITNSLNDLILLIEGEQSGKKVTENTRLTNLFQHYLYN